MQSIRTSSRQLIFLVLSSLACIVTEARLGGTAEPAENVFQTALIQHPTGSFSPLECNAALLDEQTTCQPWSSVFGEYGTIFNRKIVVPCGECIEMDSEVWGRDLKFYNGLEIQGKLVFPPHSRLHVHTTSIIVQGELHMHSTKAINGLPSITITWIDGLEVPARPVSFRPPTSTFSSSSSSNSNSSNRTNSTAANPCGADEYTECDLGERPFVVAGGKVVIEGLPSPDTPSWVPLLDVDASTNGWYVPGYEYQHYVKPLERECPTNGVLMHHSLSEPPSSTIAGSWGAFVKWTGESLKISRRSHAEHGFVIDTVDIRHCLQPKATYLVTAKVRIPQGTGLTQCAKTGKGCMVLMSKHKNETSQEQHLDRWRENESHQTEYGQEIVIQTAFDFLEEHTDDTNIYSIFQIHGLTPGEDLELLEFKLESPPREAFVDPDDACSSLAPGNGDAELFPLSAFPFRTNSEYVQIRTAMEHSNRYFQVTGREFILHDVKALTDDDWMQRGITWAVPPSCMTAKTTYRFRAKVRVHSDTPIVIEWVLRGIEHKQHMYTRLARCPPSQGKWVQCSGGLITLPNSMVHSKHVEVLAETMGAFNNDYDVDDITFELVDAPVDRLILPKLIQNLWVKGAHLLITSPSPKWDAWETVHIVDVMDHDEDSVKVQINRPIQSPISVNENQHYATEVALLSRNIVFANGGHFTVLHTPGVQQTIQGADFDGWGQAGVRDRYPIHFDDCRDMDGTVVSKNTIRNSDQRCIVLHATNNALIEKNVAFNTTGHCYALESGTEHGNVFRENLGVYTRNAAITMPQMGVSGKETDNTASTFWITNPQNQFIGNVATGSEGHGFWLQLKKSSRGPHVDPKTLHGPPNTLALQSFENNAVHSVNGTAVRISGYHPKSEATIVGLKIYLNRVDPLQVTDSDSILLIKSIFDRPFDAPSSVSVQNESIVDVRGCNDDDANFNQAFPVTEGGEARPSLDAPSAPSVFGLQVIDTISR